MNDRNVLNMPCDCGSFKERWALRDAAGIFCCYVCDDCAEVKINRYNPAIFDASGRYAVTGEESDIGLEDFDEVPAPKYPPQAYENDVLIDENVSDRYSNDEFVDLIIIGGL